MYSVNTIHYNKHGQHSQGWAGSGVLKSYFYDKHLEYAG